MSRNVPFEGFVLKKTQLLEGDYMVTFLTKSNGKIKMMTKGVKKITSKRASHIQTGNKLKWFATKHISGMWYLGSTSLISGIATIKEHGERSSALYKALQVMDVVLPEDQKEKNIFNAFGLFLKKLSENESDQNLLVFGFVEALVNYLGYGSKKIANNFDLNKVVAEISGQDVSFYDNN